MKAIHYPIVLSMFLSLNSFAQEVKIQSASDNEEIPYATIRYIRNDTVADWADANAKGIAILDLKGYKEFEVSHLGYQSVKIHKIKNDTLIYLKEKPIQLEEVKVSESMSKPLCVGNKAER